MEAKALGQEGGTQEWKDDQNLLVPASLPYIKPNAWQSRAMASSICAGWMEE